MLHREIIAVCSQIHTKHINTLCVQNGELVNVKLAVHIVTNGFKRINIFLSSTRQSMSRTAYSVRLGHGVGRPGFDYRQEQRFLFCPKFPVLLWCQPSLLLNNLRE